VRTLSNGAVTQRYGRRKTHVNLRTEATVAETTIGLLHPGEMGAATGAVLHGAGHDVVWASAGRSPATARRAEAAGLDDAGSVAELCGRAAVILSVCPPHAALDVAREVAGHGGVFVDANAVSPATSGAVGKVIVDAGGTYVDGGIIGSPPTAAGTTRLYLSGADAPAVARLFDGTIVDARVLSDRIGDASTMKMVFAAWTKGAAALVLDVRALARKTGIEDALLADWNESQPHLPAMSLRAARSAAAKGWRWTAEMEEIAATFAAAGLPDGFHLAAAELFRRSPRLDDAGADEATLDAVLRGIAG
jgi:3-hydroxyisobutyrate dehydrogenase-like beta-hydroxyacid dehydrogenase